MPFVSTLSLYIARRFLTGILGTFLLCSLLIFMTDFADLFRQSSKYGSASAWMLVLMTLLRLPAYTEILLPFAILVGSIGALLMLARKSELAVMRAGGMSVWQFLRPGIMVSLIIGVLSVVAYNPMAAAARDEAERLFSDAFGRDANVFRNKGAGTWLRQDGADGQSVMTAASALNAGLTLKSVTVFVYDRDEHFTERIDAKQADLEQGFWRFTDAIVSRVDREPENFKSYLLST